MLLGMSIYGQKGLQRGRPRLLFALKIVSESPFRLPLEFGTLREPPKVRFCCYLLCFAHIHLPQKVIILVLILEPKWNQHDGKDASEEASKIDTVFYWKSDHFGSPDANLKCSKIEPWRHLVLHGVSKGAQEVCQGAFGSILVPILNILGPNIGEYGFHSLLKCISGLVSLMSCWWQDSNHESRLKGPAAGGEALK